MHNKYGSIYILGQGVTPFRCAQLLHSLDIKCIFLENIQDRISFVKKNIEAMQTPYSVFGKADISNILQKKHKVLILSVNNTFLFPHKIVDAKNIDIINYHNSLLPKHRGRHAEAWAIYGNDSRTGITWHLVDKGIDTGAIVVQRPIDIDDNMTSLSLLKKQSQLAVSALRDCLHAILSGELTYSHQEKKQLQRARSKGETPNNGELCLSWSPKQIWSFLRAMDYGCMNTLGQPRVCYSGSWYGWKSYRKIPCRHAKHGISRKGNSIIVSNQFELSGVFNLGSEQAAIR